jgi:hypothetical protein
MSGRSFWGPPHSPHAYRIDNSFYRHCGYNDNPASTGCQIDTGKIKTSTSFATFPLAVRLAVKSTVLGEHRGAHGQTKTQRIVRWLHGAEQCFILGHHHRARPGQPLDQLPQSGHCSILSWLGVGASSRSAPEREPTPACHLARLREPVARCHPL